MTQKNIVDWVQSLALALTGAGVAFDSERVIAWVAVGFVVLAGLRAVKAYMKRND